MSVRVVVDSACQTCSGTGRLLNMSIPGGTPSPCPDCTGGVVIRVVTCAEAPEALIAKIERTYVLVERGRWERVCAVARHHQLAEGCDEGSFQENVRVYQLHFSMAMDALDALQPGDLGP